MQEGIGKGGKEVVGKKAFESIMKVSSLFHKKKKRKMSAKFEF